MRVDNYIYPQSVLGNKYPTKYNNVNFSAKTISTSYGLLSKEARSGLENLHANWQSIQDLFLNFAHYPAKAIAIKDGYSALLQKNRNQGLSFELPDNQGIMTIRRLRSNTDLMRFIVEKDGQETNFLTNGTMKVVANINKNNPQFLPRKFRYMMPNEIKESNIENYIKYADEAIQKYNDYLNQYRDPNKLKELKIEKQEKIATVSETPVVVKEKRVVSKKGEIKDSLEKTIVKKITDIFNMAPNELPADIIPMVGTRNNIVGIKTQMDDGAILKVSKKFNSNYGDTMTYLSFEKLNPDSTKSYMSIDLCSFKFLKMKDAGKPLIKEISSKEHSVCEYSIDEIKKRNMIEKFNSYADTILSRLEEKKDASIEPVVNKIEQIKEEVKPVVEQEKQAPQEKITRENIQTLDTKFEQLKEQAIKKAKDDAKMLSEVYFETFVESFNKNVMKKFAEFKIELEKIFKNN